MRQHATPPANLNTLRSRAVRWALAPLALAMMLTTQTGCATLITAVACAASDGSDCGSAVATAATFDAAVIELAAAAGDGPGDDCPDGWTVCADDPGLCCEPGESWE